MTARVWNYVLDNGLNVLDTTAVSIYLTKYSTVAPIEPVTYAQAISSNYSIGYKTVAAGSLFGSPAASTVSGRKVASVAITDGTIVATGIVSGWAVVSGSSLFATGNLSALATFSSTGNQFVLPAFEITLPAST